MTRYVITITMNNHRVRQHIVFCDCPIDWVVDNYHHDDMLDWTWCELVGGEQ